MATEVCALCGREIMRVRVEGKLVIVDCMQIFSFKLDQRYPKQVDWVTGKVVLTYPDHFISGLCRPKESEESEDSTGQTPEDHVTVGASEATTPQEISGTET